jgi:hypothetical protein
MSVFDLEASFERARRRFPKIDPAGSRRTRSDQGTHRLPAAVLLEVRRLAGGRDRPAISDLLAEVSRSCAARGLRPPSRTALYRLLDDMESHAYPMASLPQDVRLTLHNVDPAAAVPGSQLAFHCFNYGNSRALSFASGLPWLDLHQARLKRGWRAKSLGLLHAVCRARGI